MKKNKVGQNSDLFLKLPESLLHHILSYLPFEDSIRTSVLSKQWNSARKSFPFLEFEIPTSLDIPKHGEYLDFVDRSLQYFVQNKICIERMGLYLSYINPDFVPLVDTWLPLALHNGVYYLCLYGVADRAENKDVDYNYVYPLTETTFTVNSSLLGGSKYFRLEKLMLFKIYLSENMVRDIICNCPNLSELYLRYIRGLKTINISKPGKLARLQIRILFCDDFKGVFVNVLSLEYFYLGAKSTGSFDLTSCCNLKELELYGTDITDTKLHLTISTFPLLEALKISYASNLQRIRISHQRLKHLQLNKFYQWEDIEIDAPNLLSFDITLFYGYMPALVSPVVIPCSMFLTYDMRMEGRFDSSRFLEIREYLSVPFKGVIFCPSSKNIPLIIDPSRLTFDPYNLRDAVIPPPVEVECLELTALKFTHSSNWVTMLNGLLWSCHPKTVHMDVTANSNNNGVMILFEMLMRNECQLCWKLTECKCWRQFFKASNIGGRELQELSRRLKEGIFPDSCGFEVWIQLDWVHKETEELTLL